MSAPAPRPSVVKWLYNHNPFYAISTVLMLYAIRAAYGTLDTLEIGDINCWVMMGVLAAYTLVLAAVAVCIVRWGKVWEDARSILLLLLLLFLAVSISADDLFAKSTDDGYVKTVSSQVGAALMACGFLFSALVSEVVLRGAGIRLGLRYRIPYHLMLALFYAAPWWCASVLHDYSRETMKWMVLAFPAVAAVLFLSLLPAVRGGPSYVANKGCPWRWPVFPWIAFWVIAGAVGIRSYVLSMIFGLDGPIWKYSSKGRAIVFDTIWGTYFLVPLVLAILLLLLEMGLVTRNKRFLAGLMRAAPVLLLLSLPLGGGPEFVEFLATVTGKIGSPVWLTTWLMMGFYAWAWLRRAPGAGWGVLLSLALVSVIGPRTISPQTLIVPQAWPFFIIASVLLARGLWKGSSQICAAAVATAVFGLWFLLPQTALGGFRFTTCYHVLWLAVVVLGLAFRDSFAELLRAVGAALTPLASLVVMASARADEIRYSWGVLYVVLLAVLSLLIARLWRARWYLYAFAATTAVAGYAGTVLGFRQAVAAFGRPAMTAFAWSMGMLLLAVLVSAHKAHWLPQLPNWALPKWPPGSSPPQQSAGDEPPAADGLSSGSTS